MRVHREDGTGETILTAMGDAHVDVIVDRLKRKFGASVKTGTPHVPYRETIRKPAKIDNRFKRQTGGHGQFGHVVIEFEPLRVRLGLRVRQPIVGGVVPKQYIPAVEKGLREAMAEGVLAGYPVVDLQATLVDGSYHTVDSSRDGLQGRRLAGAEARLPGGRPDPAGADPGGRGGRPRRVHGRRDGPDHRRSAATCWGWTRTTACSICAPRCRRPRCSTTPPSCARITQGRGRFSWKLDHYAEVPHNVAEKVIAEHESKAATGDRH